MLLTRGETEFETGPDANRADRHAAWIDEFCLHCGADLRVRRVLVRADGIPDDARLLYEIAKAIERSGVYGSFETQAERYVLTAEELTLEERERLAQLYAEGCETVATVFCGIGDAEFVGITADGVFLYADVSNAR